MWRHFNAKAKCVPLLSLALFVSIQFTGWAGGYFFTDHSYRELKVAEIDVENKTAILESPDGEIVRITIGDVVGRESYTITKISETVIEVEGYPDASGSKKIRCIPVIPIFVGNPSLSPRR